MTWTCVGLAAAALFAGFLIERLYRYLQAQRPVFTFGVLLVERDGRRYPRDEAEMTRFRTEAEAIAFAEGLVPGNFLLVIDSTPRVYRCERPFTVPEDTRRATFDLATVYAAFSGDPRNPW